MNLSRQFSNNLREVRTMAENNNQNPKKLYKSKTDKKICGVCGGLAEYIGIDSTWVRIGWACLILFLGTGILLYFLCALVMPDKND